MKTDGLVEEPETGRAGGTGRPAHLPSHLANDRYLSRLGYNLPGKCQSQIIEASV